MTIAEIPLDSPDFYTGTPWTTYKELRATAPVYWTDAAGGFWALSKYADIKYASTHPALFTSEEGISIPDPEMPVNEAQQEASRTQLIMQDPPRHGQLRRLVSKGFTPREVTKLEPGVRDIVHNALSKIVAGEALEYAEGVVAPVPARIIAELIGAPPEDWEKFREWSDAAVGSADPDVEMNSMEASIALYGYFGKLIAERGVEYRNDLTSTLLQSEIDGKKLTPDEVLSFLWLLLVAGNETTRNLIALGTLALIDHPDQKQLLLDDMSLLPSAIEEMLRWITPVTHMTRVATQDVEMRGQQIKRGQRIVMLYGSANRDEEVFGEDAEEFKITRSPNPHIAFGTGEHSCLGLSLARLEARVFFEELLSKYPNMDLIGNVIRMRAAMVPGVRRATVRFAQ